MKRQIAQLLALLLYVVINTNSYAQINGSFETLTAGSGNNYLDKFENNEVVGWEESHGSPSLSSGAPGQGIRSAWMWSKEGRGEGIIQNYNFVQGGVYKITFWVRTNNPDGRFYIKAANGVASPGPSTNIPTPTNAETIFTAGLTYGSWTQITTTYTPNSTYSQLWIYPYLGFFPINGQAELSIDGISIDACLPTNLYIPNQSFETVQGSTATPFNGGNVTSWGHSHGNPRLMAGAPGQGNNSAMMWAYAGSSEGILGKAYLIPGRTYKAKFWVKTNGLDGRFYVKAANNVPPSSNYTIPTVSSQQTIFSDVTNHYSNWVEKTVTFTANAYYFQLWIYPSLDTDPLQGPTHFQIDNIRLEMVCNDPTRPTDKEMKSNAETPNELNVQVYPNPAASQVNVKLSSNVEKAQVTLYNLMTGKQVGSFVATPNNSTWSIPAHIKAGTYQMVVIDQATGARKTMRVVINKK